MNEPFMRAPQSSERDAAKPMRWFHWLLFIIGLAGSWGLFLFWVYLACSAPHEPGTLCGWLWSWVGWMFDD